MNDGSLWLRNARAAGLLNVAIVLINTVYVLATMSSGPHRPLLLAVNLTALVASIVVLVLMPAKGLASSAHSTLLLWCWIVGGVSLVTVGATLDGGLASPFTWLFSLTIVLTAVDHRPRIVALSGAAALVGYGIVVAASPDPEAAAVLVQAAYLIVVTYAAVVTASWRWRDHDAQLALTEQLQSLADRDGLTDLYNHRSFYEHLGRELSRAQRQGTSLGLVLIDLDRFKSINDHEGHLRGDEVLRRVARAIEESKRSSDISARVGGEEFAVILPDVTTAGARSAAERIRAQIAELRDPPVTASLGVTLVSPTDVMNPSQIFDRADTALFRAKRQGRNRVCQAA